MLDFTLKNAIECDTFSFKLYGKKNNEYGVNEITIKCTKSDKATEKGDGNNKCDNSNIKTNDKITSVENNKSDSSSTTTTNIQQLMEQNDKLRKEETQIAAEMR